MAEAAGLVLGALGIAGLFKSCVDNFDIVVRARNFSEEFDLLCTELSLQQIRLVLWGESLGFVPSTDSNPSYHKALDRRPQVRRGITDSLLHLQNLLTKADVISGRYDLQETEKDGESAESNSRGMMIFRDTFQRFKVRLDKNQTQKSTWKVTRWSIHDYGKFRELITSIKNLLDGLESITSTLGLLERQRTCLIEEIGSISDTESLRLLQNVGSAMSASPVLRLVSDRASQRMSDISSGTRSYYTAPTIPSGASVFSGGTAQRTVPRHEQQVTRALEARDAATTGKTTTRTVNTFSTAPVVPDIPQNQRWIAALYDRNQKTSHPHEFAHGDRTYGQQLATIKKSDDRSWIANSTMLLAHADSGVSLAQRMFLELRSIRRANVPFISAAPVQDSLDRLLASVEGPPGTPYEGGVFWITVKVVPHKPPLLRFQTKIYHPNINCRGDLCADYEAWWTDANLSYYMLTGEHEGFPWFSEHRTNHYSLGALLVAVCGLLSSPNVDDPLVPEIAEKYITDYDEYFKAAKLYTERYATPKPPPEDELCFAGDVQASDSKAEPMRISSELRLPSPRANTSSLFGQVSARGTIEVETVTGPRIRKRTEEESSVGSQSGISTTAEVVLAGSSSRPRELNRTAISAMIRSKDTAGDEVRRHGKQPSIASEPETLEDIDYTDWTERVDKKMIATSVPIIRKLLEWEIILLVDLSDKFISAKIKSKLSAGIQQLEELIDDIHQVLRYGLTRRDWLDVCYEMESNIDFICRFMVRYELVEREDGRHIPLLAPGTSQRWPKARSGWLDLLDDETWAAACWKELSPAIEGALSFDDYNKQYMRGPDTWAGAKEMIYEFKLLCGYLRYAGVSAKSRAGGLTRQTSKLFSSIITMGRT